MSKLKFLYYLLLLLIGYSANAQEWSSRITIAEEHLVDTSFLNMYEINEEVLQIGFIQNGGDVFTLQTNNFSAGFNLLFEEFLDDGFLMKDMFVYNVSVSYNIGAFDISFMFENFLNIDQQEFEMLPEPDIVNGTIHHTNYVLDSPFSLALGIVFTF